MIIHHLHFSIQILAKPNQIWNALWQDRNYSYWAAVFEEGSHMIVKELVVGSTVQFLDPNKNGIYSRIEEHVPNQLIRFKHIGTVAEGIEQEIDEETQKWSGTSESYEITQEEQGGTLSIAIDVMDEHVAFMSEKLPLALERIKKMSERH